MRIKQVSLHFHQFTNKRIANANYFMVYCQGKKIGNRAMSRDELISFCENIGFRVELDIYPRITDKSAHSYGLFTYEDKIAAIDSATGEAYCIFSLDGTLITRNCDKNRFYYLRRKIFEKINSIKENENNVL